jgi:cardiolipin synthase A/B
VRVYQEAEDISIVYSGHNYFEVLDRIIDECRYELHLQTYIFDADETGKHVLESLKYAVKRGVKVYLMIDAYGSFAFPKSLANEVIKAGINFRFFSPLLSSESIFIGRRLHHKIVVADRKVGLIGGINIANKYNTVENASEAWLDYAVLVKGDVCGYLHVLCEKFYMRHSARSLKKWERNFQKSTDTHKYIRFRRNDWIIRRNEIHHSYTESILKAESTIIFVASYFLPNRRFRRLLSEAASRGVKISILMAGKSDIGSVRLAENYLYDFYLRNNISLFEWSNSVMHGKAMIVDGTWATIGSYNLNFLSHYISIELNADIIDPIFIKSFDDHLKDITRTSCTLINLDRLHERKGIFYQLMMWVAYNFFRALKQVMMISRRYRKGRKKLLGRSR